MVKMIIKIGIVVSIVLSAYVGALYFYEYSSNTFAYITVIIFNILRIFTMEPDVPLMTLAPLVFCENPKFEPYVYYLYAIAVYLAPICTASILFITFDAIKYLMYSSIFSIRKMIFRKSIVLISYNDLTERIILENNDFSKIFYVYGIDDMNMDLKVNLLRHNAKYIKVNGYNNLFDSGAVTLQSIISQTSVMAICERDPNNALDIASVVFSYLYKNHLKFKNLKILCNIEDIRYRDVINNFVSLFRKDIVSTGSKYTFQTFNIDEKEIYDYFDDKKDELNRGVNSNHYVIVGFGNYGRIIINYLINLMKSNRNKNYLIDVLSDGSVCDEDYIRSLELDNEPNIKVNLNITDITKYHFYEKLREISAIHIDYIFSCLSQAKYNYLNATSLVNTIREKKENFNGLTRLYIRDNKQEVEYDLLFNDSNKDVIKYDIIKSNKNLYKINI